MLSKTQRWYHTPRSASSQLKEIQDGKIEFLRRVIEEGRAFRIEELAEMNIEELLLFERALLALKGQINEMRSKLEISAIRRGVGEGLLFLKGLLAIPLMPLMKDLEAPIFRPHSTLYSNDAAVHIHLLLQQVQDWIRGREVLR